MSQLTKDHILRIGVIREGKIIEEKLVRKRTSVTVGKEANNTIVLPSPSVPDSFTLFELRGNDYFLVFDDQMTGRISVGDEAAADLRAIKNQPGVIRSGSLYQLMLNPASKGRVVVGDFVILFQFVKPPPEPSRPQLPQAARGYWMRNIDWPYATSFGFTMSCMVILWIWSANVPIVKKEMTIEDIPDRFAKMIMPDKEMSKKKEEEKGQGAGGGQQQQQQQSRKKKTQAKEQAGPESPADAQARAAAQRAAMEKKVAGRGLLKVLGARGEGVASIGVVADVFNEGHGGGAGGDAFAGIGGLDVATSAGATGSRGFEGATKAASLQDLGTRGVVGTAGQGSAQKQEARVVARVTSAALEEFESDSRDQQDILRKVKQHIGGVQHCYERKLKRNPDLKGKIVIRFTIHPGGRVVDARVVENTTGDPELGECIAAQIRAIRFPPTEGGETVVTYPFILAPGS